jgi:anti-sigma factor RsiW
VKCSEFLHELTDYLDGVIDAGTKSELEEHLAWCHNCYVVCDTTKKTIQVFKGMKEYAIPRDVHERLMSAVERKCAAKKVR